MDSSCFQCCEGPSIYREQLLFVFQNVLESLAVTLMLCSEGVVVYVPDASLLASLYKSQCGGQHQELT